MYKETIKTVILIVTLVAISMGVADIPENTPVIEAINRMYSIVLMLFVYIIMKDI